jgi:signal transduction histidine kinase
MVYVKNEGIKLISYFQFFSCVAIFGFFTLTVTNYFFYKKNFYNDLKYNNAESSKTLISEFDQSILYAENFATFIGKRIGLNKNNTKDFIASVLMDAKTKIDNQNHDIFTWTLFDFVDPKGYVIAASTKGAIENPVRITKEERSWVETAKNKTWELFNSKIDIGVTSHEPIIPFGIGIENDNNYLGIVSFGVNIDKLKNKLQSSISNKTIKFSILDQNFDQVLSSQNFDAGDSDQVRSYLLKNKNTQKPNAPFTVNGKNYYLASSGNYPFIFVVGTNEAIVRQEFWSQFFPKVSNTLYLTIFFLLLLYFFRNKLLKPIIQLSETTNQISRKNFDVVVSGSDIYEVNILADSIREVKQFLKLEEKEKEKLKKQKNKAEQENFGKTEFLSATVHDLKNHLIAIIGAADLMKNNLNEKYSPAGIKMGKKELNDNIEFLDDIGNSAKELSNLVEDILDINQVGTGNFKIETQDKVDLSELVLRSIKLLTTRASRNEQKIICNIDEESGKIIGILLDPKRIKQILANLISNSIKYSPPHTVIEVNIRQLNNAECLELYNELSRKITDNRDLSVKDADKMAKMLGRKIHNRVSIVVKDNGFGMDEDEVKIALSKYGVIENENSGKVDSTGLGLPIVKYLVEVQGGTMRIKSKKEKGTEIEVIV